MCAKRFDTKHSLLFHLKTVHEERKDFKVFKDHLCDECGKKLGSKRNLLLHISVVHEGRKNFTCDKCQKTFGDRRNMRLHQKRVHECRKDFACDKCEKKCALKTDLMRHRMTVHEGRKDYPCEKCEKKFGFASHLLTHQKTVHEGRKDYACDKCEKKFGQQTNLLTHQKTVHESRKDYACDICERKFGQRWIVIQHQRTVHEGRKDYACDNGATRITPRTRPFGHRLDGSTSRSPRHLPARTNRAASLGLDQIQRKSEDLSRRKIHRLRRSHRLQGPAAAQLLRRVGQATVASHHRGPLRGRLQGTRQKYPPRAVQNLRSLRRELRRRLGLHALPCGLRVRPRRRGREIFAPRLRSQSLGGKDGRLAAAPGSEAREREGGGVVAETRRRRERGQRQRSDTLDDCKQGTPRSRPGQDVVRAQRSAGAGRRARQAGQRAAAHGSVSRPQEPVRAAAAEAGRRPEPGQRQGTDAAALFGEGQPRKRLGRQNIRALRHEASMRVLLEHGADPNAADAEGSTPLHIVAARKHDGDDNSDDELAEMLFERSEDRYRPVRVDARDREGDTALPAALRKRNTKVVDVLLRNEADPSQRDASGSTALHVLVVWCCDDHAVSQFFRTVDEIQAVQVQLEARDSRGRTPLNRDTS
ncbi:unnamed protein product [Trichogramma brassicae]|uniref:C2H2-type domain-containing protein n=1 Tax=Trichogramma brassicae TaxID=86971 RepID=A0A6H5I3S0_9HYME|nr:unnamed protein product [Trichogramma brassicae]